MHGTAEAAAAGLSTPSGAAEAPAAVSAAGPTPQGNSPVWTPSSTFPSPMFGIADVTAGDYHVLLAGCSQEHGLHFQESEAQYDLEQ